MISSSANRQFTFTRRTGYVMDAATAAASMTLDRALRIDSFLQVDVAGGTTGSGTVTLTGTDPDGAAQVEVLTFAAPGSQQTVNRWQAGTSPAISTTGLADEASPPTVAVQAVDAAGQPQLQRVTAAAARPVLVSMLGGAGQGGAGWPAGIPGTVESGKAAFQLDYEEAWTPAVGYLATEDATGEVWTVDAVEQVRLGFGYRAHHWRLTCRRLDT